LRRLKTVARGDAVFDFSGLLKFLPFTPMLNSGGLVVHGVTINDGTQTAQENLSQHLREVMARHKIPSPPVVVTKVLGMLKDPDFSVRQLSRIIADDPSLASRTLAISRSAKYAQRRQPGTVHEAILVLGLQTLRNIVLAIAAQSFLARNSKVAKRLWSHSLGAALAGRILARRSGFGDPELAFLAGLLHDVGEMILLHGDPRGFEEIVENVEKDNCSLVNREKEVYAFDHASIGVALLEFWNIDAEISDAVLRHHENDDNPEAKSLSTILRMADYLCLKADLGFFSEAPAPIHRVCCAFGCEDEQAVQNLVQELRSAFDEESLLFTKV
jgi:putative nucleotidyltransferase with HDIG domain